MEFDGPITLPCDASFVEYAILFLERGVTKDVERALQMSDVTSCCPSQSLFRERAIKAARTCLRSLNELDFFVNDH
ncbi:hypothetical protein WN944_028429 [Citrus x changshan-huyou]|uniref:Uncharacterized protein n=3 Tax=Citrus TaxID=2706 RepID=A0A067FXS7_CITSI|nr:hypothetical protein CICLE_v10029968mg [Citrus x clementina]KDO68222.1 hypothetical protein CISIN_1g042833mg [Citrus sinensis]